VTLLRGSPSQSGLFEKRQPRRFGHRPGTSAIPLIANMSASYAVSGKVSLKTLAFLEGSAVAKPSQRNRDRGAEICGQAVR
jgi:hypothetical protein